MKRTSGRSTGEFVVEGFRGLSWKKEKKVKMQRRVRERRWKHVEEAKTGKGCRVGKKIEKRGAWKREREG